MVEVDVVYQRVLAIANKEQRGYVTPLEFNLLANQAQMDIFEQYFYDKNQNERLRGNDTDYSDIGDILNEKISLFEVNDFWIGDGSIGNFPQNLYRLGSVTNGLGGPEAEYLDRKDFIYVMSSPLTRPTNKRPIYIRDRNSGVKVYGDNGVQITTNIYCNYIRTPDKVTWGYVVTNKKALYLPGDSTDFNHHRADETRLVMKILELAGVVINKPGLVQIADQEDLKKIQQEKA